MDSTLGLAAAVHNFGTKKSVTTKNQNVVNKMQTQNVQSLLREAKREMLIDPNELDQIQVGGDDLTVKHTQKKSFNSPNQPGKPKVLDLLRMILKLKKSLILKNQLKIY